MIIISGSSFGNFFKVTTYGESHGKAVGAIIDGVPSGLKLSTDDIIFDLSKRKPNNSKYSTNRSEEDLVEILSGIFEGKTTGTPISLIIYNKNFIKKDYEILKNTFRPGHADLTYNLKYGFRDYFGGGRSSGRETVARVASGAIARKLLKEFNIKIYSYTSSIGKINISNDIDLKFAEKNELKIPCKDAYEESIKILDKCKKDKNSIGGTVTCCVENIPYGLGEPVFDKLDAKLSQAIMSIGAVKGIEFGNGFLSSTITGYENNDEIYLKDKFIKKYSNNNGGISGGISDGDKIYFKVAVKPTPSIGISQKTVVNNENKSITIDGRHDLCIIPRINIVIEAMTCITIADFLLQNATSKLSNLKKIYI